MIVLSTHHLTLALYLAWVGLAIGNFLYQLMQDVPNYQMAAERSFFQLVALVVAFLLLRFAR